MSRNLKSLGLALLAALALSVVAAPAAPATELYDFTSSAEHTTLGGSSNETHQLTFDAGTTTCKAVDYSGTESGKEIVELELTPVFTECTADPSGTADISMNSCQLVMTPAAVEGSPSEANLALSCEAGKSMKVEVTVLGATKCTIHIPAQHLGHAAVSEVSGGDITVAAEISGIEYSQTAGSGLGACSTAENTTNGTYQGHATINGGEATLALAPIPQRVKILKDPIEFKALNDPIEFEVESQEDKKVEMQFFLQPKGNTKLLTIAKGCVDGPAGTGVFLKKGEKCKEKIECIKKSNETLELAAITQPIGGDVVKLKGC